MDASNAQCLRIVLDAREAHPSLGSADSFGLAFGMISGIHWRIEIERFRKSQRKPFDSFLKIFAMLFSEKIEYLMKAHNLSQYELAKRLAVSTSMVHGWLNGSRPQKRIAAKIAENFAVPVDALLEDAITLPFDPRREIEEGFQLLAESLPHWNEFSSAEKRSATKVFREFIEVMPPEWAEALMKAWAAEKVGPRDNASPVLPTHAIRVGPSTRSADDYVPPGATQAVKMKVPAGNRQAQKEAV